MHVTCTTACRSTRSGACHRIQQLLNAQRCIRRFQMLKHCFRCEATMPPKKKSAPPPSALAAEDVQGQSSTTRVEQVHESHVGLLDESSDSEWDDDPGSRQIGRDAARDTLGPRSREHYSQYQDALRSWGMNENTRLPPQQQYKLVVPFSYRLVANYLDDLKQKEIPWPNEPGKVKHYSTGLISAVICSIRDAYRIEELRVQEEIDSLMSNFYKAYCKFIGREKMLGRYPLKSGRCAISSAAFKMISKKLFELQGGKGNWHAQIQMWPYWNVIGTALSRAERVGNGLVDHISSKEDMLLFDLSTSKTDPTGILSYPKCIASNPFEPQTDVFLGLGVLFFCRNAKSDKRIFSYADMPATASLYLKQVLDSLNDSEECLLGCPKQQVGLHTAKKTGCSKLYDNECTVSVAIEKRCDHHLHSSQGAYIGDLPANDAFNARILAGLPFGTEEFAAKPCHFDRVPQELWARIPWKSLIHGYATFPASCKFAMPLLLAALIHHEGFIRHRLSGGGGHPILFSPLFTVHKHLFDVLRPYIKVGLCQSEMTTTGVPLSSKTHATVHRIDVRLANIERALQRLNLLPPTIPEVASLSCPHENLISKLDKVIEVLAAMSVSSAGVGHHLHLKAPAPMWGIGYLPTNFRIAPLSVDQLWRAWHVATSSCPALQGICGKMLPAGEHRVNDIRQLSRYSQVVECIKGSTKISAENVEESFEELWNQCEELALDHGMVLGSTQQGAGTFYNRLCSNKTAKEAMLSRTRRAVVIGAKESAALTAPAQANNGIFFQAVRQQSRASQAMTHAGIDASVDVAVTLEAQAEPHARSADHTAETQHEAPEIPHITTVAGTWRAWWCAPFLRYVISRNNAGSTRMSRYRQAVEYVRCEISLAECERHPEVAFDKGWATLEGYLKNMHGVRVYADGAPSRQVPFVLVSIAA